MKRNSKIIVLIAALVVVVLAVIMSGGDSSVKQETPALLADTTGLDKVIPVIGRVITEQPFQETVTANGVIEAWYRTYLASETGGRVLEWSVDIGDRSVKGNSIIRLDDEVASFSLQQAEAGLDVARVSAINLKRNFERLQSIHQQGDLSDNQLEDGELGYQNSQANLKTAEATVGMARRALAETQVRMPFTGHIAKRMVEIGQSIGPGTPVAEVVQTDPIRLSVGFSERDIVRIRVGQRAVVNTVGWGNRQFIGTVHAVGAAADAVTRLFPVEIKLSNSELNLKPGMAAMAEITVAEYDKAIVLPVDVLFNDGEKMSCYAVKGDRAEIRNIKPIATHRSFVMVESGISAGETLVVVGQDGLKPGQLVKVNAE